MFNIYEVHLMQSRLNWVNMNQHPCGAGLNMHLLECARDFCGGMKGLRRASSEKREATNYGESPLVKSLQHKSLSTFSLIQ